MSKKNSKNAKNLSKNLTLYALNEINFHYLKMYADKYNLKNCKKLLDAPHVSTKGEETYELLEPWIQWVSVHTGKEYSEHEVFRLGQKLNSQTEQIFEKIENLGYSVGAISPMNAQNRLNDATFFIPDPWIDTHPSGSILDKKLYVALKQAVNDNSSGKIKKSNTIVLLTSIVLNARPKNYFTYISLALRARKKRWNKALFLDLFLSDLFHGKKSKLKPSFSTLFLNSFAHIQHHYFFSSEFYKGELKNPSWYISQNQDPLKDASIIFDRILGQFINSKDYSIIATGLRQVPYLSKKFYYRLRNHKQFFDKIGIKYQRVRPSMTRDFEIEFACQSDLERAEQILSSATLNSENFFGDVEIQGLSIFASTTYPHEIQEKDKIFVGGTERNIIDDMVFVALKNGMHDTCGYQYVLGPPELLVEEGSHVANIYHKIHSFFERPT